MRCCPKCGEKYEDSDIRSICASCMVALAPYKEQASAMSAPGPVTVGPASSSTPSMVTTSMPDIAVPEMRIPDIPAPAVPTEVPPPHPVTPPPQPIPPPITPQPEPDYPQPTIIPEPTPEPQPVPQPVPAPQPTPMPTPEPPAPSQPAQVQASELPNLLSDVATPAPVVTRVPPRETARKPEPRGTTTPPVSRPAQTESKRNTAGNVRRQLTAEEQASSKAAAGGMMVFGAVCLFIGLLILFGASAESFSFFTLLFLGGFVALGVYLVRQAIYRSAIHSVQLATVAEPRLGAPLQFAVTIGTLRDLQVTNAELTLTAEERVVRGSGKSQTTLRHTLFSRTIPFSPAGVWPANGMFTFNPQITLPPDALPSFSGDHYHIEWTATLWVGIPGWYPDIRERLALTVPALRIGAVPPPATPHRYALPNLGDLRANVAFDCATNAENIPLLPAGQKIPFSLDIHPEENGDNRKLWIELSYLIIGAGDNERTTVDRVACFRRGWQAGVPQQEQAMLTLPANVPLSYQGANMQVHWNIAVRMEIPWLTDRQQAFQVIVIPGNGG